MRQKRAKTYKKLMALYSMSFGFRQPYQVLVDSEICKEVTEHKLEFVKQLGSVLQGEVKPMITQCCIHELYLQQRSNEAAVELAKTFERRKCNHREAIPGDECLKHVVGDTNKHRYVIASQNQPLRTKFRAIPAVPLIHINRSVMVLEPPSDATIRAKNTAEEQSLHSSSLDKAVVSPLTTAQSPHKKKGPKGPNPLSVKKKKATQPDPPAKDKDKGSKKAEIQNSVPSADLKRRRTEDDDAISGDEGIGQTQSERAGPKRKRRRRGKKLAEVAEESM
ncbi:hypothetical protein K435DRAFT_819869 [Dendrothele bispora CBS 962.96]|uniref:U three protein 23 n=1 Tax=Dendrothele bispora (strain CBS 962.96) TaxID=1314807 RepID=A0A4S8LYL1_DENBC|nr:hypothetical protein K435DRAFT_819869 [Dendrothele bispora CBS 962.96]